MSAPRLVLKSKGKNAIMHKFMEVTLLVKDFDDCYGFNSVLESSYSLYHVSVAVLKIVTLSTNKSPISIWRLFLHKCPISRLRLSSPSTFQRLR
jgi:hypothetical protein